MLLNHEFISTFYGFSLDPEQVEALGCHLVKPPVLEVAGFAVPCFDCLSGASLLWPQLPGKTKQKIKHMTNNIKANSVANGPSQAF